MIKLVFVITCFAIFSVGSAIKCYNCQSTSTENCNDYSKIPTIVCEPTKDALSPVCIRRILQSSTTTNVTLQCVYKQNGNECDPPSVNYNVTHCQMCQKDLCNTANSNFINLILVTMMSLLPIHLVLF